MEGPWSTLLFFFAPALGVIAVLWVWKWRIGRRQERVPTAEKLLRPAGESLRKKLEALDEELSMYLTGLLTFPAMAAAIFLLTFSNKATAWIWAIGFAAVVAVWMGLMVFRVAGQMRNYRLGFYGERAVGEELNQLMLDGCRVFHDVPNEPYGNIDHVIVATSGVYAVETKTRRKRKTEDGKPEHKVVFDGKALQFPSGRDVDGLEQAQQQASRLAKWLSKATGESVRVAAILTLPGWYVESRVNAEIKVLNPRQIRGFVAGTARVVLGPEQFKRVVHQLDQVCRDVAL